MMRLFRWWWPTAVWLSFVALFVAITVHQVCAHESYALPLVMVGLLALPTIREVRRTRKEQARQ